MYHTRLGPELTGEFGEAVLGEESEIDWEEEAGLKGEPGTEIKLERSSQLQQ